MRVADLRVLRVLRGFECLNCLLPTFVSFVSFVDSEYLTDVLAGSAPFFAAQALGQPSVEGARRVDAREDACLLGAAHLDDIALGERDALAAIGGEGRLV